MYALEVESLTQKYADKIVVDSVSFKVKENTVHGFLGPNGAGKTTTLKSICGVLPILSGQVKFFDEVIDYEDESYKNQFGALIEEPSLYEDMLVEEFLKFLCKLYNIQDATQRVNDVLDKLMIQDIKKRLIKNLSKGYRQRVAISATLIHNPKIVILDEPTVGLDVSAIAKMREIILNLKKDHTILISSHILHEMQMICDEVTLIHDSKIIAHKDLKTSFQKSLQVSIENSSNLDLDEVKKRIEESGVEVVRIENKEEDLESFFFNAIRQGDSE